MIIRTLILGLMGCVDRPNVASTKTDSTIPQPQPTLTTGSQPSIPDRTPPSCDAFVLRTVVEGQIRSKAGSTLGVSEQPDGALLVIGSEFGDRVEVVNPMLDQAGTWLSASSVQAGWSVASAGDLDDDGFGDVWIGFRGLEDSGVFLMSGAELSAGGTLENVAWMTISGVLGHGAGRVVDLGDVTGDGQRDVGVSGVDRDGRGALFVFDGPFLRSEARTVADAYATILSDSRAANLTAAVGDVDGDGDGDLALADQNISDGDGAVYLLRSPIAPGVHAVGDMEAIVGVEGELLGHSVSFADVNGNGRDEMLLGAPYADLKAGRAYVIDASIRVEGTARDLAMTTFLGEFAEDRAGFSIVGAGDFDGDGIVEVQIGAKFESTIAWHAGVAYLMKSPVLEGTYSLTDSWVRFEGEHKRDLFGACFVGSDFNGDGQPELLIAAKQAGHDDHGAVYVYACGQD